MVTALLLKHICFHVFSVTWRHADVLKLNKWCFNLQYATIGDVKYASGTYRIFKLPQNFIKTKALVTYKGTVPDCAECFEFDASHSFKVNSCFIYLFILNMLIWLIRWSILLILFQANVPVEVGAEMAAILQNSRFFTDFNITMLDTPDPNQSSTPQVNVRFCGHILFILLIHKVFFTLVVIFPVLPP